MNKLIGLLGIVALLFSSCIVEDIPPPNFHFNLSYSSSQEIEQVDFTLDDIFYYKTSDTLGDRLFMDLHGGLDLKASAVKGQPVYLGDAYIDRFEEHAQKGTINIEHIYPHLFSAILHRNGQSDTVSLNLDYEDLMPLQMAIDKDETAIVTFNLDIDASWKIKDGDRVFEPKVDILWEQ